MAAFNTIGPQNIKDVDSKKNAIEKIRDNLVLSKSSGLLLTIVTPFFFCKK